MKKMVIALFILSICLASGNIKKQMDDLMRSLQYKYQISGPEDLYKLKTQQTPQHGRTASRDMGDLVGDWRMEEENMEVFITVGSDQSIPDFMTLMAMAEAEGSITATTSDYVAELTYLFDPSIMEGDDGGDDCDISCEDEYNDYNDYGMEPSDIYCECCHEDWPLDDICENDGDSSGYSYGPRIGAYLTDLDPGAGGAVYFDDTATDATVTFVDVPLYDDSDAVQTFQIQLMYGTNEVILSYKDLSLTGSNTDYASGGLAIGIADGSGEYNEVDFSTASEETYTYPVEGYTEFNWLDMEYIKVTFTPNSDFSEYTVSHESITDLPESYSNMISVQDDSYEYEMLSQDFLFYGENYNQIYINNDGNIGFESGDEYCVCWFCEDGEGNCAAEYLAGYAEEAGGGPLEREDNSRDNHGGVEFEYGSVADLYAGYGSVLETVGTGCDGCTGNLDGMDVDTSFDIASQSEFEYWANNFGFAEYYFQFIDENENDAYDGGEIYAVSCENGNDSNMTVAYNGSVYELQFEDFWMDAYDFDWDSDNDDDDDDDEDEDDGPDLLIMNMNLMEFFMASFGMDLDSLNIENPTVLAAGSSSDDDNIDMVMGMMFVETGVIELMADPEEAVAATSIDTLDWSITFTNLSLYDSTGTAVLTVTGTIGPGWIDFEAGVETPIDLFNEDGEGDDDMEFYVSLSEDSTGMDIEVQYDDYYGEEYSDTSYFNWSATTDSLFLYYESDYYYYEDEADTMALGYMIIEDTLFASASFNPCEDDGYDSYEECFGDMDLQGYDELVDVESFRINQETVFTSTVLTSIEPINGELPEEFKLYAAFPNPFNPVTTIRFDVGSTSHKSTLRIYDISGRNVATLINGQIQTGSYEVQWDARGFASGIYFSELISGTKRHTQKMVLLK